MNHSPTHHREPRTQSVSGAPPPSLSLAWRHITGSLNLNHPAYPLLVLGQSLTWLRRRTSVWREKRRIITTTHTTVIRHYLGATCVQIRLQTTPTYCTILRQIIWLCQEHSKLSSVVQNVLPNFSRMPSC